jgi:hypothetical protein
MTDHRQRRHFSRRPGGPAALIAAGLAAATCVLALAACGSSGKSSRTVASVNPQLAFAECMRSQGVPNFPDPSAGGGGIDIPDALAQSPAFKPALQACRSKLQPGGGPHGGLSESTRLSLLKHAQCMRAHGVPNYPDPNIPSHGPYMFGPPPGFNTNAPAFTRAAAACGGP